MPQSLADTSLKMSFQSVIYHTARGFATALLVLLCVTLNPATAGAQEPPSGEGAEGGATTTGAAPAASPADPAGSTQPPPVTERRDIFPELNLYLPEGELDIRLRKMIRNVLFEGQVNYNFVDGDVSTFLRYKYYARNYTYKLGVFDTIEFQSVDSGTGDFNRVRGGLLLFELPMRANHRYLGLVQADGLSFGDVTNPDNHQTNAYLKLGYLLGSPFDERLNAITGESRGRITPVLTAYREIGPQKIAAAFAVTQGVDQVGGDFQYTKVEAEGLKRFDLGSSFLISRLHAGSFLSKRLVPGREAFDQDQWYSVPRYELFRAGGRDALKGFDDHFRGTDEIHLSNEYFRPIFLDKNYRTWQLEWTNLYGIGYLGAGNLGFGSQTFTSLGEYVVDAGLGVEASVNIRDYEVFLSTVYARTVVAPDEYRNSSLRFSVRTSR